MNESLVMFRSTDGSDLDGEGSTPLKRLESSLNTFINIAIPTDLQRLGLHRQNIDKFQKSGNWSLLHREQVNASRTVQSLKANLNSLEKTRFQCRSEDLPHFDKRVEPIKKTALESIQEFMVVCDTSTIVQPALVPVSANEGASRDGGTVRHRVPSSPAEGDAFLEDHIEDSYSDREALIQELEEQKEKSAEALESWRHLQEGIHDLNYIVRTLNTVAMEQREKVELIEDKMESAATNIDMGNAHMARAAKLKATLIPLAGAAFGAIVGGPLGFLTGVKAASLVTLAAGSALGYGAGTLVKNQVVSGVDQTVELSRRNNERHDKKNT